MEKKIIPKATRKQLFQFRPSLKTWYEEDRGSFLIEDRTKPWHLTDDIIDEFIETDFDWDVYNKKLKIQPDINLNGFSLFYMKSCLLLIKSYCTFNRLKRILERYIEIEKQRKKISPGDRYELINETDSDIYSSEFLAFELFTELVVEVCSKNEIKEIEKIIDKNYDIFLQYEIYYYQRKHQHANLYFDKLLQENFPFSEDFIYKYHDYFLVNSILENPVTKNLDMQKYIFGTILPANLRQHLSYHSRQSEYRDFILDEETVDGLVLKYNLR